MTKHLHLALILTVLTCSIWGCGGSTPAPSTPKTGQSAVSAPASTSVSGKIKFKTASGDVLASMKPKEYGYKVVDGQGADLGKIKRDGERIKVKIGGATQFKVKPKDGGVKLSDAAGNTIIRIKRKGEGFQLRDGGDTTFAQLKKKGSNWTAVNANGDLLALVKVKDTKCKLYDASDKGLFSISDKSTPAGTALMAVTNIPIIQRCALYAFFKDKGW